MLFEQVKHLFLKDLRLEWRHKTAIGSALLYLLSTVFITYLAFENYIMPGVWSALFWIIIVFVTINTVSRSFASENEGRYYFYYTLSAPEHIIMGKILYNALFMLMSSLLCYVLFSVFFGNYIQYKILFLATLFFGSTALSSLLSMTSAIAWKAGNSFSLTAVLSLPLVLPILIVVIRLTHMSIGIVETMGAFKLLAVLFLLNFVIVSLTHILFPYIWKN